MEDRNSISCNNQVENCQREFQFPVSVNENASHLKMKQYRRDFLLQLRLHPLSLRKPGNLPDIEVVKERLYLHSIIDSGSSADKYMDLSNQTSLKSEYCNLKHEYSLLPHYFNRLYPYCFSPHVYSGPYQNSSSKFRSSFHTYCNPLKKHCVANHSCYKDFSDECIWAKRNYASSEDVWSSYPSHVNANFTKKKESLEAVSKSRKKLPIIDPVTGKNVLEAVSSEKQKEAYAAQGNADCSENYNADMTEEKFVGDCFYNDEVSGETSLNTSNKVFQDTVPYSSEDKIYYEKIKDVNTMYQAEFLDKTLEGDSSFEEAYDRKTAVTDNGNEDDSSVKAKDELETSVHFTAADENENKRIKNKENMLDTSEANKLFNRQVLKIFQNKVETNPSDIHGNCQVHHRKDCSFYFGKESVSKQNDMKDSLKQLREKIYSLRQEQQKMVILQSFLRYKKYQLEESARNLDEKRIEIANWECTLFNKAKRLHDKELWLDSKSEILFNKAQHLAEREKILSKEEDKVSCDSHNPRSGLMETQFSEKCTLDNCVETSWDEIPAKVKNIYNGEENNEYTYFTCGSNPNKIREKSPTNVEKCKSDICSLDELERNIVLIEKMNPSNGVGDTSFENKTELSCSSAVPKKDDSTSCDPLGYSKGRRYLPEHIKYWLNKRDKSAL